LAFHSGREADHSPPSSAEIKEWVEMYLHSPNTPSWCGAQLGRVEGGMKLTQNHVQCVFILAVSNLQVG
jgi:hypothetical protein